MIKALRKFYRRALFDLMLRRRLRARLKDVIIDHIYVMGFEKIHLRQVINEEGSKAWYGPAENKFVEIFDSKERIDVTSALKLRLYHRKLELSIASLNNQLSELIIKGYIVEGKPIDWSFALTAKGIFHYSQGRSFEDNFMKNRLSRWALWLSIPALIGAIISILKAFCLFPFE